MSVERLCGNQTPGWHVCGMCHGKAAKRYWRVWVKQQKSREKRAWKREQW